MIKSLQIAAHQSNPRTEEKDAKGKNHLYQLINHHLKSKPRLSNFLKLTENLQGFFRTYLCKYNQEHKNKSLKLHLQLRRKAVLL